MLKERCTTTEKSIEKAKQFLKSYDINYKTTQFGTDIVTMRVLLDEFNIHNQQIVGNGKGLKKQSLARALFEAIEHYFTENQAEPSKSISTKELSAKEIDLYKKHYALNEIINNYPDTKLKMVDFQNPLKQVIRYPDFLLKPNDHWEEKLPVKLSVFATNNGTATGVNLEEALLHGILEIVERDSLSIHFLKHFMVSNDEPLCILPESFLNDKNSTILNHLKSIFDEVQMVNITTNLKIPSVLVIGRVTENEFPFIGTGTSLDSQYAIERALTESLQSYHLKHKETLEQDLSARQNFKKYPNLVRCMELNYDGCDHLCKEMFEVELDDWALQYQIDFLIKQMACEGMEVYYRILHSDENVTCVKVIIFGAEQFHLIRSGNIIMPSKRGMNYLRRFTEGRDNDHD